MSGPTIPGTASDSPMPGESDGRKIAQRRNGGLHVDEVPEVTELPEVRGSVLVPGFEGTSALNLQDSSVLEAMEARFDLYLKYPGLGRIKSGIPSLDSVIRLATGDHMIIAGPPGSGKSSLVLQWARHLATASRCVYVLTEMSLQEVIERIIANAARVPLWKVQTAPSKEQTEAVKKILRWVTSSTNLDIIEAYTMSVTELKARLREYADAVSPPTVFIDNLYGLGFGSGSMSGSTGQVSNSLGQTLLELVNLSKSKASGGLGCPVVTVHHTNRDVASRAIKPGLHHLGSSENIGRFTTHAMILRREREDNDPKASEEGTHVAYLVKQRGGATVRVPLRFVGESFLFEAVDKLAEPYSTLDRETAERESNYRKALEDLPPLGAPASRQVTFGSGAPVPPVPDET